MNGKEKILDQLKNNHQQCQNRVLARGWLLRQRSGEIELTVYSLMYKLLGGANFFLKHQIVVYFKT
jgi:hypothetical protein